MLTSVQVSALVKHFLLLFSLPFFLFSALSGNRSAAVNAATMALIDAGVPIRDFVCACSASYIEDTPILGLNTGSGSEYWV